MRDDCNVILKELYGDFYSKSYELMKKREPLYGNSDQDLTLFLKFLNDHDMKNYASFLSDLEKDKPFSNEYEYDDKNFEFYNKYFQPDNEFYLHLKGDFRDEENGTRSLGIRNNKILFKNNILIKFLSASTIINASNQLDEILLQHVFGIFLEEYGT